MNIKTVTLCIGNSDDKLKQSEWSEFCKDTGQVIHMFAKEIHFSGHSVPHMPWQNACWVFICDEKHGESLAIELEILRRKYRQDSIAIVFGDTKFLPFERK